MEKTKTSITIDKDLYEKIQQLADKKERSFSQQVSYILKEYLSRKDAGE